MTFSLDKSFVVVFNSRSNRPLDLPIYYIGKNALITTFPDKTIETYLGFNITDRVAKIKIDWGTTLSKNLVPYHRSSPNPKYLKQLKNKFNRARLGTFHLCQDNAILFPKIANRLFKTLQRSNLLYAMEICDWNVLQIQELEKLQAKSLRSLLDLDRQCPKALVRLLLGVEPIEARLDFQVLLFYAKLCHSEPNSFLGKMHKYRSSSPDNPPIRFYTTVKYTLAKYKLSRLWNDIPRYDHLKLKSFLAHVRLKPSF